MPSAKKDTASNARRKSDKVDKVDKVDKTSDRPGLVTLKVSPAKLRAKIAPETVVPVVVKEDTPTATKDSPATTNTLPAPTSTADNASDSTPNTPANGGTPAPQPAAMGPPTEGPKKKGAKRTAAALGANGEPKVRGKPGPKKKARLEDGSIDPTPRASLGHKLGPKANQGAINAGLRALDRSGKPCRKWAKGSFVLKSFTGTVWEIPRWTAPARPKPVEPTPENSTATSAEGNAEKKEVQPNGTPETKENKDVTKDNKPEVNGQKAGSDKENEQVAKSDNSNSGGDVEMQDASSVPPSAAPSAMASSPAPTPVQAATPIAAAS